MLGKLDYNCFIFLDIDVAIATSKTIGDDGMWL